MLLLDTADAAVGAFHRIQRRGEWNQVRATTPVEAFVSSHSAKGGEPHRTTTLGRLTCGDYEVVIGPRKQLVNVWRLPVPYR